MSVKKGTAYTVGPFYLIVRDPATVNYNQPQTAYYEIKDAKAAAEKLARESGQRFYILEAVEYVEPTTPPVKWSDVA